MNLAPPAGDDPRARTTAIRRVLLVILLLNWAVALAKAAAGWLGGSVAMLADAAHSGFDGSSNLVGLVAVTLAAQAPDREHPYGHARVETAATLILGASLALIGFGILWEATLRLQAVAELPPVEMIALWVAIATAASWPSSSSGSSRGRSSGCGSRPPPRSRRSSSGRSWPRWS